MVDQPNGKKLGMWNDPTNPTGQLLSCFVLLLVLVGGGWLFYTIYHATNPNGVQPQSAVSTSDATPSTANLPPRAEAKKDLEVLDSNWKYDGSILYVGGTVANNSKRTYGYVQVEINLYDKEGDQIESTFANVSNLEPGKKWKFKALVSERKESMTFKVKGVVGY